MLKVAVCLVLFAVATYIGNFFARRVEQRPAALERLRAGLDGLRTRLEFRGETLRIAFANMAGELSGDMAGVFARAAELMEIQPADETHTADEGVSVAKAASNAEAIPAGEALKAALLENRMEGGGFQSLKDEDIEIAQALAGRIGGDSGAQQAAFALADNAILAAIEQARAEKASRGRLYRASGMLLGALLAVLFI